MNKSSRIEFEFLSEGFENIKSYFVKDKNIKDLIYLSLHSSQSIYKTKFFHSIDINFKSNHQIVNKFKFSKILVTGLEWPFQTYCENNYIKNKSENRFIYSFEDCVNSCIFEKYTLSISAFKLMVNSKLIYYWIKKQEK
jgi:hypothetical protein